MNPSATYSKSRLIKELAFMAGIPQVKSRAVLEALGVIIRRETALGPFILPGVCKFDTTMRKERRIRNPRTGEALILPAQKALRFIPSKSLRNAAAPRIPAIKASTLLQESKVESEKSAVISPEATPQVDNGGGTAVPPPVAPVAPVAEPPVAPPPVVPVPAESVADSAPSEPAPVAAPPPVEAQPGSPVNDATIQQSDNPTIQPADAATAVDDFILPNLIPEESAASASPASAPPKAEPPVAPEPEFTVAPNGDITFHCKHCGQEIEAPSDMAGTDAECPMCGAPIHVPTPSGQTQTTSGEPTQDVVTASEAEAIDPSALKNKTIRIDATELGFDEPAPAPQSPAGDTSDISFFCPGCHQEIEATADMAGTSSECPNCGTAFVVPFFSEKGSVHAKKEELFDPRKADKQKHKTMRIDLDDF